MKHHYLIVDSETTSKQTVADFGAVIMDRKGNIVEQFGVLLNGHFGTLPLWSDPRAPADAFWSTQMAHRRKKTLRRFIDCGTAFNLFTRSREPLACSCQRPI